MSLSREIPHSVKRSVVVSLKELPDFTPERGRLYHGIEVVFENRDTVRHYSDSFSDIKSFAVGSTYVYQLKDTITRTPDGESKVKTTFIFKTLDIPWDAQSQMLRVQEIHSYIKESARIAASTFTGELGNTFSDIEFKDRAAAIYEYMKDRLLTETFNN